MARPVLRIKRLHEQAIIPTVATTGSSGMDLYALEPGWVYRDATALVRTGIAVAIPRGYEGQVRPRSGLALKEGVTVVNSPGTIDADYRGEVCVILATHKRLYSWRAGDRVAQLVIQKVPPITVEEVDDLDETARGAGGLGSTGK